MAQHPGASASHAIRDRKEPTRSASRRLQLYAREYPILIEAFIRLIDEVAFRLPQLTLLALFGSVARLEAGARSDTDLLALFDVRGATNTREREDELAIEWFHIITATISADGESWPRWGITTVAGDALGNDLDADLLSVIGREGVLSYHRANAPLTVPLDRLTPFGEWREHVQAVIAKYV